MMHNIIISRVSRVFHVISHLNNRDLISRKTSHYKMQLKHQLCFIPGNYLSKVKCNALIFLIQYKAYIIIFYEKTIIAHIYGSNVQMQFNNECTKQCISNIKCNIAQMQFSTSIFAIKYLYVSSS